MQLLIAIVVGVVCYWLLMKVFGKELREEEAIKRRISDVEKYGNKSVQSVRKEILQQPFFDRTVRPVLERMGALLKRFSGKNGKEASELKMKQALYQSGSTMTVAEYTALQISVTVVGLAIGMAAAVMADVPMENKLLYVFLGFAAPYILMRYSMAGKITKRKEQIEHQLPEVLDLMSVSVEAGLGFEQAMLYIINNMEGPVVNELAITYREITMGRSRKDAFVLLGERCGTESAKSFANALVQATELGISMKVLLQTQSEAMRKHRKRQVEEKAMQVSTKLLFPLIFFIFPALFVVLLGPAALNILNSGVF